MGVASALFTPGRAGSGGDDWPWNIGKPIGNEGQNALLLPS